MERWHEVDEYLADLLGLHDDALDAAVDATVEAGMPEIQVSPSYGKFLQLIVGAMGARRILEIGTLAGYSAIWLARALPADGQLITLELDPRHADVARINLDRAGVGDRVEIMVGPASDSLARLASESAGPFDLVFIDADKESYPDYLDWSVRLARQGSLIIADNVVRGGALVERDHADARVRAVRLFSELLARHERLDATILQTVGAKGYDGVAIAVVR